ncbi:MAG: hypothetical protein A2038_09390 [Deltaproteobacteria bacterium GWA2_57_13]|nr:MAG: hypothetical protein A2038_09390 [Deltaproteobacteria bacterium GWA2_57_13]
MGEKDFKQGSQRFGIGLGLLSGLVGMLCCVTPAVLVLFSLTTATAAVSLATRWYTEYAWYLRGAAALLAIAGIVLHLRRRNACSLRGAHANLSLIVTTAVVGVLAYGALYWITTWLGTLAR